MSFELQVGQLLIFFVLRTSKSSVFFDALIGLETPYSVAACIGPGNITRRSSSVADTVPAIKKWMETCQTEHQECKVQNQNASVLPDRVLDVSDDKVCIHETAGVEAPYLTLSHCWGQEQIVTTTKRCIPIYRRNIPRDLLSKTFQEAIELTRRLCYQFIWIDSLCIVQDDKQDWETQSAKMASIYGGSDLQRRGHVMVVKVLFENVTCMDRK